MNFQKIIQNPWTKRIGIATPIIIGGIVFAKKQHEKNQWSKIKNESKQAAETAKLPAQTTQTSPSVASDLEKENGIQYNANTLVFGSSKYQFTKSGVKKLQSYLSENSPTAARHISMSGGIDGQIGRGFVKALYTYAKEFGGSSYKAYSSLLKNSGLNKGEVSRA